MQNTTTMQYRRRTKTQRIQDQIPPRRFEDEEEELDSEDKSAEMDDALSMRMLKTRSILLSGEVNKDLAERVVRSLLILESLGEEPVKIFIDSPGGDVHAGYAIFDMIRFIRPPVITIGMGLVASAAALIYIAADKKDRLAFPNSQYLLHQPMSGMRGVASEIEIHAQEIEKTKAKLIKLMSEETGKSEAQIKKDTDRDYWLNAKEAVKYGLVSRIITQREELDTLEEK